MAKNDYKESLTVKPSTGALAPRPVFARPLDNELSKTLSEFMIVPRIKIVQKSAQGGLGDEFKTGTVLIMPNKGVIAQREEPFLFVPLHFYVDYTKQAPVGSDEFILERSANPDSWIAKKSRDPKQRKELVPNTNPPQYISYVETLNFVVTLFNHPLAGMPLFLSFSKGEHYSGRQFINLFKMREAAFECTVFQGQTGKRERKGFDWYGFDIVNPNVSGASPWVEDETLLEKLSTMQKIIRDAFAHGSLKAAEEEDLIPEAETLQADAGQAAGM